MRRKRRLEESGSGSSLSVGLSLPSSSRRQSDLAFPVLPSLSRALSLLRRLIRDSARFSLGHREMAIFQRFPLISQAFVHAAVLRNLRISPNGRILPLLQRFSRLAFSPSLSFSLSLSLSLSRSRRGNAPNARPRAMLVLAEQWIFSCNTRRFSSERLLVVSARLAIFASKPRRFRGRRRPWEIRQSSENAKPRMSFPRTRSSRKGLPLAARGCSRGSIVDKTELVDAPLAAATSLPKPEPSKHTYTYTE